MQRLALLVSIALTGCIGNAQRSARVPHPSVPLDSGQAVGARADVSLGFSNLTDFGEPRAVDHSQAIEVPETQTRAVLRFQGWLHAHFGMIYERGYGATSHQPDRTQAPVGDGDVVGHGLEASYSWRTGVRGFVIGTTAELTMWSVPWVEYFTSTDEYSSGSVSVSHGRDIVPTLGVGITPSYRRGHVTVFGGAFVRNHPTMARKEYGASLFEDPSVSGGPINILLHAGVEVAITDRFSTLVAIHQDLVADPVQYGPGIAFAVSAKLGALRPDVEP